jgi:hypothetical protein
VTSKNFTLAGATGELRERRRSWFRKVQKRFNRFR